MINPQKLEKQKLPKYNKAIISIISLVLLYYIQNKRSNLF